MPKFKVALDGEFEDEVFVNLTKLNMKGIALGDQLILEFN